GGIRDQLAQENLLVAVQGVNHQLEKLLDLSLKSQRLRRCCLAHALTPFRIAGKPAMLDGGGREWGALGSFQGWGLPASGQLANWPTGHLARKGKCGGKSRKSLSLANLPVGQMASWPKHQRLSRCSCQLASWPDGQLAALRLRTASMSPAESTTAAMPASVICGARIRANPVRAKSAIAASRPKILGARWRKAPIASSRLSAQSSKNSIARVLS